MRSTLEHTFSQVPKAEIERSSFDRSHGLKTTFDAGYLIPIFVDEALPGDTFNLRMNAFARLATPLKPLMDNLFLDTFFFAVPYRLVWDNWKRMNGEQDAPGDTTDYTVPQMVMPASTGAVVGSLADYFGIPTGVPDLSVSALPFRAYALIVNDWFRDQNLQVPYAVSKGDGPDVYTAVGIARRGKRHDYFTSCLPWPQKGTEVQMPLGATAPVVANGVAPIMWSNGAAPSAPYQLQYALGGAGGSHILNWGNFDGSNTEPAGPTAVKWENPTGLQVDLADATSATINRLREAFQMQRLFERDARGGTRYTEIIRSHFGVISPDARLQRPEYLGGGSSFVNVHPVAQTSASGTYAETPQGNLSAFGTVSVNGHGFTKSFTEHCIIIGLACVRADLTYQQGLNRMWSRKTRYDFYWPALSHLGEQAVLNKEIFAQGTTEDDGVFGYQERYAEYRYKPSLITGQFRSQYTTPLDMWHLAQDFATLPALNAEFIVENPPIARVVAVPSEPHFLFDGYFSLKCARPMPVYGVPGLIDHF